jgi:anti-sigma regulatory factor (Ser/Thr protein kinase)
VVVPHHPRGAHIARHRLASDLDGLIGEERLSDAVAIAAELVGNAVVHADPLPGDVIRVAWRLLTSGGVEIRVTDGGSPDAPEPRLADHWGVERDGLGQCVWASIT